MTLKEKLHESLVIGDGAMGTLLYQKGIQGCFEELNVSDPDQIEEIHRLYIEAGADLIQTNTYAANASKLARYQLSDCVEELNRAAVNIARKASAGRAYVAATIGGVATMHQEKTPLSERMAVLKEQTDVLLNTDADGFLLETFYDFDELKQILTYIRAKTDRPVIAQATLGDIGVLHTGMPLQQALEELEALGADVCGINCRMGPYHMLQSLEETATLSKAALSVYPNASLPNVRDGRFSYQSNPSYFGDMTTSLAAEGAVLIGGCCGTTPEHIREIRRAVEENDLKPVKKAEPSRKRAAAAPELEGERITKLTAPSGQTSVIVELDPPKALSGVPTFMEGARKLTGAGVDAVTLADNSLASSRIDNLALGARIKAEGSRPLLHIACRDRNIIGLQSHLLGMHELGIRDILAITGDPAKVGDFPGATSVYDMSSMDLIRLIKQLNEGTSFSGKDLGAKTDFTVGAAFNANARRLDREVQRLEKKVEAGADFFMSQPVYSSERIEEAAEAVKGLDVPVYIGIMPLVSSRNAEFLHHEVPGIKLTDEVRDRMKRTDGDREAGEREGILMAKELIDTALKHFRTVYLITPFLRYSITETLTAYIREQEKTAVISGRATGRG
ncbi:bifunctional homocysteine S-methyltransferase/methylenetetrahydrofolate reductase [Alkalicoccus luteus]|uniref:Bifunctional homocysteine S-methyltransferase/methylenetetrahydrofolate reductase n=1 Tax=Alkalicoccus luteus TaxID=1237094 RepID=A0A969PQE8_9BACI|nr:bifunctional homocysteine S-methyltransferase/methylenetetrahydrofolate reductase [Alkalicoccus luteus]NJP38495.1 bifunctional homocysteine S-methyltransferase/methylenetetrahydrofolate reductase [Alkalicoccus luteus]